MEMTQMMITWLILVVVFLVIEICTVGLTCIWFSGGSLAGLILSMFDAHIILQVIAAVVVTIILLVFTRPFVKKYVSKNQEKTNYEQLLGQIVCIEEVVDNVKQTGKAVVNGQEWTVRSEDGTILLPKTLGKVVEISGVKLILKAYKEEM